MSTYGQAIHDLLQDAYKLNKNLEWLRDYASLEEKKYYNDARGLMFTVENKIQQLQDSLGDRCNMELS